MPQKSRFMTCARLFGCAAMLVVTAGRMHGAIIVLHNPAPVGLNGSTAWDNR